MNLARISANGQITVPVDIRRTLRVSAGDQLLFFRRQNGDIVVSNASLSALKKAQKDFRGSARKLRIKTEADAQALVDEIRKG